MMIRLVCSGAEAPGHVTWAASNDQASPGEQRAPWTDGQIGYESTEDGHGLIDR
jgi:hypothetical protein